jgi:hypothetical protein
MIRSALAPTDPSPLEPEPELEERMITEVVFIFERGWKETYVFDEPFELKRMKHAYLLVSKGQNVEVFKKGLAIVQERTGPVMLPKVNHAA